MENEILFENVSFSYDGKEVFRNLNVRIPSDRHVALVGENGGRRSDLRLPGTKRRGKVNVYQAAFGTL